MQITGVNGVTQNEMEENFLPVIVELQGREVEVQVNIEERVYHNFLPPPQTGFLPGLTNEQLIDRAFNLTTYGAAKTQLSNLEGKKWMPVEKRPQIKRITLTVFSICPFELFKRTTKYAMIGGTCGFMVDVCTGNKKLYYSTNGAALGAFVGFTVGTYYSVKKINISLLEEKMSYSQQAKEINDEIDAEKCKILVTAMNNYAKKYQHSLQFNDYVDPLSFEFMECPVTCPHGTTYDKKVIEKYIDIVSEKFSAHKENFPHLSDRQIAEKVRYTDPVGRKFFGKDQLVFNDKLCRKSITFFQEFLESLEIHNENDEVMREGVERILKMLTLNRRHIVSSTAEHIRKVLYDAGATSDHVMETIKEMKKNNKIIV